jgi:hypothetical protein
MKMKSSGMPWNLRVRASCVWFVEGNACVESKYAMIMFLLRVCASSRQRLRCVIALEQERPSRKPSCSELEILCASI